MIMKSMLALALLGCSTVAFGSTREFVAPSAIRWFSDHDPKCEAFEGGTRAGGMCEAPAESTVAITKDQRTIVQIDVVYGYAAQREFVGLVTSTVGSTMHVTELESAKPGAKIVPHGCRMEVTVKNRVATLQILNAACDGNLTRASGAKLKN